MVEYLLASPSPQSLTDNFKNPFTGETTLEMLGGTSIKAETAAVENDSVKSGGFFKKLSEQIKALFQ